MCLHPFLMEVGPAKTNQCIEPFYLLVDLSMENYVAVIFPCFCKTTKNLKIPLLPSHQSPWWSACHHLQKRLHSHEHHFPAHLLATSLFLRFICPFYILHLLACMDCKNGVSSLSSLYCFPARMSRSGDGIKEHRDLLNF